MAKWSQTRCTWICHLNQIKIKSKLNISTFNQLFDAHFEEMCRIVYPILHERSLTKDVVQDVYLSLWKNRNQLKIKTSYKAYIYRACTLRAIDEIRKRKTKNTHFDRVRHISSEIHNPVEEEINRNEMQAIISEAVQSLPDTTKEIFVLKRYSDLKNKEIAEQLNVSIKTVESHMTKALKTLRELLGPYLNSPLVIAILYLFKNYIEIS